MTPNQQAFRTALRIHFNPHHQLMNHSSSKSVALNPFLVESFNQRGFALACLI
jgi:hypothetical protein